MSDLSPADVAATFCATLFDEWQRCGLTSVFGSPGSRSTPVALAADAALVDLHLFLDERTAAFAALGHGLVSRRPAVVFCTSGTAAVNFHPAVVEAHHSAVPLLVVTTDRPPELQGVGAPQTIDQTGLFGDAVRWAIEPGPPVAGTEHLWRPLADEAWERATLGVPGPVHLNLAFREPLVGVPGDLPPAILPTTSTAPRFLGLTDEQLGALIAMVSGRRVVLCAGVRTALSAGEAERLLDLCGQLGWVVIADHLSGLRLDHPAVINAADAMCRDPALWMRPEVVLHWGGLLASKAVQQLLEPAPLHLGFDRWGLVPDPQHNLTLRAPIDLDLFCDRLTGRATPAPPDWAAQWRRADDAAQRAVNHHLASSTVSEPAIARTVVDAVPPGGALVVSSSMPIRDVEAFGRPRADITVVSNRGANGIDGVVSTAIGVALTGTPTVLLIGDLAFLHDVSALTWLMDRDVDLTIVVVDNDGGGIFSFLAQADQVDQARFERLWGTSHGLDVTAIASAFGLTATTVTSVGDFSRAIAAQQCQVIRVVSGSRPDNVGEHRRLAAVVAEAMAGVHEESVTPAD